MTDTADDVRKAVQDTNLAVLGMSPALSAATLQEMLVASTGAQMFGAVSTQRHGDIAGLATVMRGVSVLFGPPPPSWPSLESTSFDFGNGPGGTPPGGGNDPRNDAGAENAPISPDGGSSDGAIFGRLSGTRTVARMVGGGYPAYGLTPILPTVPAGPAGEMLGIAQTLDMIEAILERAFGSAGGGGSKSGGNGTGPQTGDGSGTGPQTGDGNGDSDKRQSVRT